MLVFLIGDGPAMSQIHLLSASIVCHSQRLKEQNACKAGVVWVISPLQLTVARIEFVVVFVEPGVCNWPMNVCK